MDSHNLDLWTIRKYIDHPITNLFWLIGLHPITPEADGEGQESDTSRPRSRM